MYPYENSELPISERVEDLISRMTLPEKIAQMQCRMIMGDPVEELGDVRHGLGEVAIFSEAVSAEERAGFSDTVQEIIMEKNGLGIPAIIHCEAITGADCVDATIYPSAIALGATWNPKTIEDMAAYTVKELLAIGVRQALSPVMDICRDPRWGRIGETYGEDPTLCAAMSVAFTRGLQGEDMTRGVIATGKHFLGYGMGEGGLNMSSNPIPMRELRESYGKPFQAAISQGNLESVMNSYGTVDGEQVVFSESILSVLLREEMGFEGFVVSDYKSIDRAFDLNVCKDPIEGGIKALKAGLDIELPKPYAFTEDLIKSVEKGLIHVSLINNAVKRVLKAKFKLGLFENYNSYKHSIKNVYKSRKTYLHSLKAARESIVLLKNENLLPLSKNTEKIAIIGPHSKSLRLLFGGYTYPASLERRMSGSMEDMAGMDDLEGVSDNDSKKGKQPYYEGSTIRKEDPSVTAKIEELYADITPTIYDSICRKCPEANIVYEYGCDIAGNNREKIPEAVEAAKNADVVILVLGGKYGWGNNCTIGEGIDNDHIGLTGVQEELAKEIFLTKTPAVFVHMDARPLSSKFICENYPVVIENWFPGITGGRALADVIFGDYNPAGRLPLTVAANTGQIPIYAMHRKGDSYSGIEGMILNKYAEGDKRPLHYFGEGMGYSEYEYSGLKIDKQVKADGIINLFCDVKNISDLDGEEVVQVYVSDDNASMLRPEKELAGFRRVGLKAGEKKTIAFRMRTDQFAFLDKNMKWIVEAGPMTVSVGSSSEDIRLTKSFEIQNTAFVEGNKRGFFAESTVK